MYEGWLINWKEDFSNVLDEMRAIFTEKYNTFIKMPGSGFQEYLESNDASKEREKYNALCALSLTLESDFVDTSILLNDCFIESISWAIRNFLVINFVNRLVQAYIMTVFLIDHVKEDTLGKMKFEDLGDAVDSFYNEMDNYDLISLRRANSVIANPFDHYVASKNFSPSHNFYAPEFFVNGSNFVKDSIKINKFDLSSSQEFESTENFETQIMSTFKTGYNALKMLVTLIEKI